MSDFYNFRAVMCRKCGGIINGNDRASHQCADTHIPAPAETKAEPLQSLIGRIEAAAVSAIRSSSKFTFKPKAAHRLCLEFREALATIDAQAAELAQANADYRSVRDAAMKAEGLRQAAEARAETAEKRVAELEEYCHGHRHQIQKLKEQREQLKAERDEWRRKALDVETHPVVVKLREELASTEALRSEAVGELEHIRMCAREEAERS